jgi:biofilm regulator BssS
MPEITTFPVTGWEIKNVPAYDIILLNLQFLSSPMQRIEQADPGRNYAMTPAQIQELIAALQRSLEKHRSDAPQAVPPGEKH